MSRSAARARHSASVAIADLAPADLGSPIFAATTVAIARQSPPKHAARDDDTLLEARPSTARRSRPRHAVATEDVRTQLTLRRMLAEVGVPIGWVPGDSADAYRVVEQLVKRLPEAPLAPNAPGEILVIAGPATTAQRTAEMMRTRLRLSPDQVWVAACTGSATARTITDVRHARQVAADARLSALQTTIIVVGLDDSDEPGHETWAADVVRAIGADALWVVVDARLKPSDTRAQLAGLGRPDALVVTSAERSASPASVWELGVPTAFLDGRPATRGGWAVLLIDKLADLEQ